MQQQKTAILLIEDNDAHAELISRSFEYDERYVIEVVECFSTALEYINANEPDIIISDLRLPDGDGIEFLEKNDIPHNYPVIVMTSFGDEKRAVSAMRLNVLDYVVKSEQTLLEMPKIVAKVLREWDYIIGKKKAEQTVRELEEKYRIVIENANEGIIVTQDGKIKLSNNTAALITGYEKEELQTLVIKDLVLKNDKRILEDHYDTSEVSTLRITRKDGNISWIELNSTETDWAGKPATLNFFSDITKRKEALEKIRQSLEEKEVLLKEIHHRVKNNLQIISSMLNLQTSYVNNEDELTLLINSQNRIRSMALIHEQLYQSEDLSVIDIQLYIPQLINQIISSFTCNVLIDKKLEIENIPFNIDIAIPCGLIINELVTNSINYAFEDRDEGVIEIHLNRIDPNSNMVRMEILDDGIGVPADFDFTNTNSLGLKLVDALVKQLRGTMSHSIEKGLHYTIDFPLESY